MTPSTYHRSGAVICMLVTFCLLFTLLVASGTAAPPTPELYERLKQSGQLEQLAERMAAARERGINNPKGGYLHLNDKSAQKLSFDPENPVTLRALAILVDFSDHPASDGFIFAQPSEYQQQLFSVSEYDNHYSLSEFYRDNSFGGFILEGDVIGWYRMPQTYEYYVDNQNGWGNCPRCAGQMATDAIDLVNPDVDFSMYDGDDDHYLDALIFIYAGDGAEWIGGNVSFWSHMSWLAEPRIYDGMYIETYTCHPEEQDEELSNIGIFAHEYGHYLGLPDLYDPDYTSNGVGDWSLMSYGSWNGNWGEYPAYFDAWCKSQLGFITPIQVTENLLDVAIPDAQYNPVAYRIWEDGASGPEYFLIENRQAVGRDWDLPGSGLQIWHIDETQWGNFEEPRYLVGLEQADGRWDMEGGWNQGDPGDVWSTLTKTEFDELSTPNSRRWDGSTTKTAVWNISAPDSVMSANLDITYSRPYYGITSYRFSDSAFGNDDGFIDPGETISFTCTIMNIRYQAFNVSGAMSSDNADIFFDDAVAVFGDIGGGGQVGDNNDNPIVFTVPADFAPCIDSFYLLLTCDDPYGDQTLGLQVNVGPPQVLVVDDDDGDLWELSLTSQLFARRIPYDVHNKFHFGPPSAAQLNDYPIVMWLTGNTRADILSTADVDAMKSFMDGGGSLFLTGQTIVKELDTDDQSFLNNYLRVTYDASLLYPLMLGVDGSFIGDGLKIRYGTTTNQTDPQVVSPINGSVAEFTIPSGATVISYDDAYKLVLFSFGFEAVTDQFQASGWATQDDLFERIADFFILDSSSINPEISNIAIAGEISQNVVNHTPTFSWSISDTTGGSVVEYEVKVGSGRLCHNSDDLWSPTIMVGGDSSIVYDGDPLQDGQSYILKVRVNNGTTWSNFTTFDFKMNTIGEPGNPFAPVNDDLIATATPTLQTFNAFDPDEDTLTYDFELYDDPGLSNLVTSQAALPQAYPFTAWTVDVSLNEDQQYYWRTRCHDGFEHTGFSVAASFWVNAVNQPPGSFSLIGPPDQDTLSGPVAWLTWQPASDNDPGDIVSYTLQIAGSPAFNSYIEMSGLSVTQIFYQPEMNVWLYWRVIASDFALSETYSSETYSFISFESLGCCIHRGDVTHSGGPSPVDISDLVYLVDYMFTGGPEPFCFEEANVDGSPDGQIDISDLVYLVDYMFTGGPPPPPCLE